MKKLYRSKFQDDGFIINHVEVEGGVYEINYPKLINSEFNKQLEITQVLNQFDFNFNMNMVIFGLRNTKLIEAVFNSLTENSYLTVIEFVGDDEYYFEADDDFIQMIFDPRIKVIMAKSYEDAASKYSVGIHRIDMLSNVGNLNIIVSPYMADLHKEFISNLKMYMYENTSKAIMSVGNDAYDTLRGIGNHVNNLISTTKSPSLKSFKDKYKGQPGILVAAGPSLDKNIDALKRVKDNALIFAVDTVTNKLYKEGIIPDAITTIERDKIVYEMFYKDKAFHENTVFIGPSVVDYRIVEEVPNFVIAHRYGDAISRKIAEVYQDDTIELGTNCAHVAYAMLKHLGCDPIIFVGQDLAFSKSGNKYFEDDELDKTIDSFKGHKLYPVPANEGGTLLTLRGYLDTKIWFEQEIAKDGIKRKHFNATAGGAKIYGAEYTTLSKLEEQYLSQPVKKFIEVYKDSVTASTQVDHRGVYQFFKDMVGKYEFFGEVALKAKHSLEGIQGTDWDKNYDQVMQILSDMKVEDNMYVLWTIQSVLFSYRVKLNEFPVRYLSEEIFEKVYVLTDKFLGELVSLSEYIANEYRLYVKVIEHNMEVDDVK